MAYLIREIFLVPGKRKSLYQKERPMPDTSSWPRCPQRHPVQPGNDFCGICGQPARKATGAPAQDLEQRLAEIEAHFQRQLEDAIAKLQARFEQEVIHIESEIVDDDKPAATEPPKKEAFWDKKLW